MIVLCYHIIQVLIRPTTVTIYEIYIIYILRYICVFLAERIQKTGKVEINKIFY